jgi:dihydroxy-acid dehydratase
LFNNGVPMDLDAMTVTGTTWRERLADSTNLSAEGVRDNPVILAKPRRAVSGVDVLRSNWFESAVVKISGMPERQVNFFDEQVATVLFFETEEEANEALLDICLLENHRDKRSFEEADLRAMWRHNAALLAANGGLDLAGSPTPLEIDSVENLDYVNLFDTMVKTGTLKLVILIAAQGPEAFGMPEMFTPMQFVNNNRALRKIATIVSDGRYSGVSYGAAVGHVVPEAARGGDILRLQTGDLLHMRFRARRIDLLDPAAFRVDRLVPDTSILSHRDQLAAERMARLAARRRRVAASNRMTHCTDASMGVVPQDVWDECDQSFWDVESVVGVNA